jgi:hypothetical protein
VRRMTCAIQPSSRAVRRQPSGRGMEMGHSDSEWCFGWPNGCLAPRMCARP